MRSRILVAISAVALLAVVLGLVVGVGFGVGSGEFVAPAFAANDGPKNLQVLSKKLTKKELRVVMKEVSKAVGKSCDSCHDLENFAADNELKKKARQMFKLTNSINARLKKDGYKKRVKCMTCHDGDAVPK